MSTTPTYALILAGGRGSRMKSELPKPCLCIREKSMLQHVIDAANQANLTDIAIVYNPEALEHLKVCIKCPEKYIWIEQSPSLGTGHAVQCAVRQYFHDKKGNLVVLNADAPFIHPFSILAMLRMINVCKVAGVVLSWERSDPFGYGRILEDEDLTVVRIVEEKDASEEEKRIQKVNGGAYVFNIELLRGYIEFLTAENAKGEYYLTDIFEILCSKGYICSAFPAACHKEIANINTLEDLKRAQCMFDIQK